MSFPNDLPVLEQRTVAVKIPSITCAKNINIAFTCIKDKASLQPEEVLVVNEIADNTAGYGSISTKYNPTISLKIPVDGNVLKSVCARVTPDKYQVLGIPAPCHELLNYMREKL